MPGWLRVVMVTEATLVLLLMFLDSHILFNRFDALQAELIFLRTSSYVFFSVSTLTHNSTNSLTGLSLYLEQRLHVVLTFDINCFIVLLTLMFMSAFHYHQL